MYEFFDALNAYVAAHPNIIQCMYTLFWLRWWIFAGLMGAFVYLMWSDRRRYLAQQRRKELILGRTPPKDRFVA